MGGVGCLPLANTHAECAVHEKKGGDRGAHMLKMRAGNQRIRWTLSLAMHAECAAHQQIGAKWGDRGAHMLMVRAGKGWKCMPGTPIFESWAAPTPACLLVGGARLFSCTFHYFLRDATCDLLEAKMHDSSSVTVASRRGMLGR